MHKEKQGLDLDMLHRQGISSLLSHAHEHLGESRDPGSLIIRSAMEGL